MARKAKIVTSYVKRGRIKKTFRDGNHKNAFKNRGGRK